MTITSTIAPCQAFAVPPHFTGKERDTESGNDYMFARYYNSATGRFLSPDWDAKSSDPVPYAKLDNPQSLNLYAYVRNNPMELVDTDGHAVSFGGDQQLQKQFNEMASESTTLQTEYKQALKDDKVDVLVRERGGRQNEEGSEADTDVSKTDKNGITHVTIWVDPYRTKDDQVEHEWGHEQQARNIGGTAFQKQYNLDKSKYPSKSDHDKRSEEQYANGFMDQVNSERTASQKAKKKPQKKEKKETEGTQ